MIKSDLISVFDIFFKIKSTDIFKSALISLSATLTTAKKCLLHICIKHNPV